MQLRPPFMRSGASHVCVRSRTPLPHGTEHSPHSVHEPQPPSTGTHITSPRQPTDRLAHTLKMHLSRESCFFVFKTLAGGQSWLLARQPTVNLYDWWQTYRGARRVVYPFNIGSNICVWYWCLLMKVFQLSFNLTYYVQAAIILYFIVQINNRDRSLWKRTFASRFHTNVLHTRISATFSMQTRASSLLISDATCYWTRWPWAPNCPTTTEHSVLDITHSHSCRSGTCSQYTAI